MEISPAKRVDTMPVYVQGRIDASLQTTRILSSTHQHDKLSWCLCCSFHQLMQFIGCHNRNFRKLSFYYLDYQPQSSHNRQPTAVSCACVMRDEKLKNNDSIL